MQIWIVKTVSLFSLLVHLCETENQEFLPLPGSKIPSTRLILRYARMLNVSAVDALDPVNCDHKTRNEDENDFAYLCVCE